jgi:hypothetical protein
VSKFVPGYIVGKQLLDALGIPSTYVTRVELVIVPKDVPLFTVTRMLTEEEFGTIREVLTKYALLEVPADHEGEHANGTNRALQPEGRDSGGG